VQAATKFLHGDDHPHVAAAVVNAVWQSRNRFTVGTRSSVLVSVLARDGTGPDGIFILPDKQKDKDWHQDNAELARSACISALDGWASKPHRVSR